MSGEGSAKITQVYVFDGDDYLGWDCFEKDVIQVGSSAEADLVLDDSTLRPVHARIRPNGVGAILEDLGGDGQIIVSRRLSSLDAVNFGRFTLKVRVKPARATADPDTPAPAASGQAPPPPLSWTFSVDAGAFVDAAVGELCANSPPEVQDDRPSPKEPVTPEEIPPSSLWNSEVPIVLKEVAPSLECTPIAPAEVTEEPAEAPAAERLEPSPTIERCDTAPDDRVLEVIHTQNGAVVEVILLEPGELYEAAGDDGPIPVAQNRGGHWFFVDGQRRKASTLAKNGRLVPFAGEAADTSGRCAVPPRGKVVIASGVEEFVIRAVPAPRPQDAPPPATFGRFLRKSLTVSAALHVLVMVVGAFSSMLVPAEAPKTESVVVELEPPPQPRTPAPKAVRERPRVAAPKETVRLSDASKAVPVTPRAAQAEVPRESHEALEPAAAAAPGKSEAGAEVPHVAAAPPRDVRQSGIFRALGVAKGISLGPNIAVAAVGDVVVAAEAGEPGVKVGTLVARLGKTQVNIAAGASVATKGGSQVLGAGGTGAGSGSGGTVVGALDKGQTGQRQVRALVSGDVKRTANVQGGMSREEVKKVIDQHMDEVTYCYETSLVESPSLMGKMTLEWRIQSAGTVGEVSIQSSTLRSDSLHTCIKRAIRSWQFPKPRGAEVIVSYPFIFDVVGF